MHEGDLQRSAGKPLWARVAGGLLGAVIVRVVGGDWPQWRGPDGQGHAAATRLPATWSEHVNVTWKTEIPGRGWSSPVIAGDQVWLTTARETPVKPEDTRRRLQANTGDQPLTLLEQVELRAVCVNRESGQLQQDILMIVEREPQWVHALNSYASPTPVFADNRLFCHFGTFGTAAVDTRTGAVLWTNTTLRIMHENGPGSSPIVWKGLLIFHLDGSDRQYLVALDQRSGEVIWKTDRTGELHPNPQLKKSYATPLVLDVNGQEQLISPASNWVYGYDATGQELWRLSYEALGFSVATRPVAGHGMFFLSTGFMRPEVLAIRYQGVSKPQIVWRSGRGAPQVPSPLLVGDELYYVTDAGGLLTCLEAQTGREHYRERLGGNYSASPIYAGDRLYFCSREGLTSVIKAGKQYERVSANQISGRIFASPAAVDSALFLRSDTALYRIEERPRQAASPHRLPLSAER